MPEPTQTDFLSLARDRFEFGRTADAKDRERAEYDNKFANADAKDLAQWDEAAKKLRKKHRRPIIQWNRIQVSVQQVVNDGRQNKPSIRIAAGDQGDPKTAEYFEGRIRHIEYEANVDTAKDTARGQQVTSGRGFARVSTEYIPGTFDQRITVDRIENQFSVVWDPAAVKYDRSDADWCFVISQISDDAHKRKYGKGSIVNQLDFADAMKLAPDWIGIGNKGEMIQIAEYFVREYKPRTLCLIGSTGLPQWKDEFDPKVYEDLKAKGQILAEREDRDATIVQYVINGAEVLDKTEWIGSTIPIVPFWGREEVVDGERRTYSLVREAIGPQQLLNFYISSLAELVGQIPKSPMRVPVGGIPAGQEGVYKAVHSEPYAYLLYNAYDPNNPQKALPPPERIMGEPPIQALVVGINQCIDGIKASMGIYDASLGAQSNETSGIAIQRRRQQSNVTNFHFVDNEARSNKYLGEILIEIIPKVDKVGKSYPIRTEDGKTHLVPIGVDHEHYKTGERICHDLKSGQYKVTVSSGPSYQSQRQEVYDRDAALVQASPELVYVIGPQMFRADDTPGAEERAEAIEAFRDAKFPGVFPKKGQQGQPIPPEVQQQLVALQQEVQKAHGFAQSMHEQLATKQPELENQRAIKQMDLDFQREKLAVEAEVAKLKVASGEAIEELRQQVNTLMHERQLYAATQEQAADQQHQAAMAQQAQDAAAQQQQANAQQQPQDQQ